MKAEAGAVSARRRRAVIVGGGIGGMTAALVLARAGLQVSVLERAAAFTEVGAGIQISPNGARVLQRLGLGEALRAAAYRPERIEMRSWQSGATIFAGDLGDAAERRFGAPYLNLHRADLLAVLAEGARRDGAIELLSGAECVELRQDAGGAAAILRDGRSIAGDLVVGADGLRSRVRAALFGAEHPRYTGCLAWRGVVPAAALAPLRLRPAATNWMGPRAHFVHYFIRGGELVNFVAVVEAPQWGSESWMERGDQAELARSYAGWNPAVTGIIAQADPQRCFKWPLFDRPPLRRWGEGRVTLLGDACHPTLPFMAQGACMAIEDAAVLGQCLASGGEAAAALRRYEDLRRHRTARVQQLSRRNMTVYHLEGPKARARDLGMALAPWLLTRVTDDLFGYDAMAATGPG